MLWYSDTTYFVVVDCVYLMLCLTARALTIYILYTRRFSAVVPSFSPLIRIDISILCKTLAEEGIKSRTINTRHRSLL